MLVKRKHSKRLTSAEAEAELSFQLMMKRWDAVPKFAKTSAPPKQAARAPSAASSPEPLKSLMTPGGSTALKAPVKYTGTAIVGIATMHKSNLVPIFNATAAEEVAKMRR